MKLYAIRDKRSGEFYSAEFVSNHGSEFCNAVGCNLVLSGDPPWFTWDAIKAQRVIDEDPEWYNSGAEHPRLKRKHVPFAEVVEFELIEKVQK